MIIEGVRILERMIDPGQGNFSPEVAKYFLSLDFSPEQHTLSDSLSAKAADGTLTASEAAALDELIAANALMTVLQSKARLSLHPQTPAA